MGVNLDIRFDGETAWLYKSIYVMAFAILLLSTASYIATAAVNKLYKYIENQ